MTGSLPHSRISGGQEGWGGWHPPPKPRQLRTQRGEEPDATHSTNTPITCSSSLWSTKHIIGVFLLYTSPACLFQAFLLCHFTFSLGFSCTNKVRRFNKLPCVSWALEQLQLCCRAMHGFLAAAARQSHAAWSAAQDGGLIAIKACFKVQFLPSTRAQSLGSLSTVSHTWLPCTQPAQTAAFCVQNATETYTMLSHLTADDTEKWFPQLSSTTRYLASQFNVFGSDIASPRLQASFCTSSKGAQLTSYPLCLASQSAQTVLTKAKPCIPQSNSPDGTNVLPWMTLKIVPTSSILLIAEDIFTTGTYEPQQHCFPEGLL